MKIKYKLLSYPLSADTYGYGGKKSISIKKDRSISKGDSCNTFILRLSGHSGTHIDCPNHFYNSGKRIHEYKIENFIFSRPVVLDCPKSADELISVEDIKKGYKRLKDADLLLLKTGFFRYRETYKYGTENPGIGPDAAEFIRLHLGNIRCIGIDSISISPYQNRKSGKESHKIFFKNTFKNAPVHIIEDMDLSGKLNNLEQVYAFPLFIKDIDSSPCTVVGIFRKIIK